MDLRLILNSQGPAAAAVAVPLQQLANDTYIPGKTASDTSLDFGDFSHASEHSLQSLQPLHAVVNLQKDVRNSSSTQMQQRLSMLQNDFVVMKGLTGNTILQGKKQEENLFTGSTGGKSYICNTCGKVIARQCDLRRHSEQLCELYLGSIDMGQNAFTVAFGPMSVTIQVATKTLSKNQH